MSVLEALLASLPPGDEPVLEVLVGAYWTMVRGHRTGLATTLRDKDPQHGDGCGSLPDAGRLHEKSLRELAGYLRFNHPLAQSIGMAALQALLPAREALHTERGAFDLLAEKGRGRRIVVVGHFPFVPELRDLASDLQVLEQRPRPGDLPASAAPEVLPRADVVCLTGTSLLNGTFEPLVALCPRAYVVLTGPSTPLAPELFRYGVDALCGVQVEDPVALRPYLTQGASFRQMHRFGVRLLTLEAASARKEPS